MREREKTCCQNGHANLADDKCLEKKIEKKKKKGKRKDSVARSQEFRVNEFSREQVEIVLIKKNSNY